MNSKLPVLAVSVGDPAGIGPELALKAIQSKQLDRVAKLKIFASKSVLRAHAASMGAGFPSELLADGDYVTPELELRDVELKGGFEFGRASAACGAASYAYLQRAMEAAKRGEAHAIVTGPVHKESWQAAKVPHIGHTEALAEFFSSKAETVFVVGKLRIFFVTRHVSLRQAIDLITKERVLAVLRHAKEALGWFGVKNPKLAVAGLNPHAGNGGLFGDEEPRVLAPAVQAAREEGIDAYGPLSADSVFHQCAVGDYDGVISLYHDQGHIAAKMKSFLGTVAVTTGLPVLRTSVDHGTAFDIAGKNLADPESMIEALRLAAELVVSKSK